MENTSRFAALGLCEPLLVALSSLGYEEPTPIQGAAIPPLLAGRDLLGQAATGTGKTAAFALPLLQRITRDRKQRALVLVPTRELAMQVAQAIQRYGKELGGSVVAIYGGAPMLPQVKALERGTSVVVATPGRALDHIRRNTLKLADIEVVVLDEADEMLDMSFAEDLEAILSATPPARQIALFSATLPSRIVALAAKHLHNPVRLTMERDTAAQGAAKGALSKVRQLAYVIARAHKPAALCRVLDVERPSSAIIFCRTRTEVDELTETLSGRGFSAEALHGGMTQEQRDRVMKRFRAAKTALLIATDVAARGLDIEQVSHVINYDVPSAPEAYVHRIGRTGRAGRAGVAITLIEPREHRLLRNIEQLTRHRIEAASVPTVAELRASQLERLRAALRDVITAGELQHFRDMVEALSEDLDVIDVAAATLKLRHDDAALKEDITEIPSLNFPVEKTRGKAARAIGPNNKISPASKNSKTSRGEKGGPRWDMARIFIGAGREQGLRPGDLVGAIVNEAGAPATLLGAIQISARHSLVEVPSALCTAVITALRATRIKGRKVVVRRDRDVEGPRPSP